MMDAQFFYSAKQCPVTTIRKLLVVVSDFQCDLVSQTKTQINNQFIFVENNNQQMFKITLLKFKDNFACLYAGTTT